MTSRIRQAVVGTGGAVVLTGVLLFGTGGTALAAAPAQASASTQVTGALAPTDRGHHQHCWREFHRPWWAWDRYHHRHGHPGWWSWRCG
jgi:hypothetical protein